MSQNEERSTDVIRLEERTRCLERSDRKHFLVEMVLFLAFIALALIVVSGCTINTPSKKEAEKEWVLTSSTAVTGVEKIEIAEKDGNWIVAVSCDGERTLELCTEDDLVSVSPRSSVRLHAGFEETKITVYEGENVVAVFELK